MNFKVNIDAAIEASVYVLNRVPSCDIHKLFKILYFAEKAHLAKYGRPITGDYFVAMKNGPVPSFVYDLVKFVRGDKAYFNIGKDVAKDFQIVNGIYIGTNRAADTDYLAASSIECLEESIEICASLNFDELTELSHDDAWMKSDTNSEMNVLDIASAAGANIGMLSYIQSNMENQNSFSWR
ncbi:MAG: SocA family protein [Chitinophagaceae bacterium]|nr:SocA family protein [Chitinophagaceae bacterium]